MKNRWTRLMALLCIAALVLGMGAVAQAETTVNLDEKPVLKWLGGYTSMDPNEEYAAKLLEERTGYTVEYYMLPSENANQKLTLELSAGTHYDVLKLSAAQYAMLVGQNALLAIEDYLADEPSIYELTDPKGWHYVQAEDGSTYGVPEVGLVQISAALGYRADIFEELGLEEPTNIEEFYDLLVALKEETGKIPLTGNQAIQYTIASGFGLDNYTFYMDGDTPKGLLRHPGVKSYLEFMNKLYNEGLLDVDWPVNKSDNINTKMSTGEAIMTNMSWTATPGWKRTLQETIPEADFGSILPLADENGVRHINPNSANSIINVMAIPRNAADNAPYVLNMIAARLEQETWWSFNAGTEGVHYNLDENGVPIPIQPIFTTDMNYGNYFQTSVNFTQHPITWQSRVAKDEYLYDAWYDMNLEGTQYEMTFNPFSYGSFTEFDQYNAALAQKINDYFLQVIVGSESLDGFDAFVASWEASGGLEMEAGAKKWYDANPEIVQKALATVPSYYDKFVGGN